MSCMLISASNRRQLLNIHFIVLMNDGFAFTWLWINEGQSIPLNKRYLIVSLFSIHWTSGFIEQCLTSIWLERIHKQMSWPMLMN